MRRRNDFWDLEDQIRSSIDNAFNYINFNKMRDEFNSTAYNILDELKHSVRSSSEYFDRKIQEKKSNSNENDDRYSNYGSHSRSYKYSKRKNQTFNENSYITNKPYGRIKGMVYYIVGITGSALFGIALISTLFLSLLVHKLIFSSAILGISIVFAILTLLFLILTSNGSRARKRIKRLKKYKEVLANKNYCKIEDLAQAVGKKNKYVLKDLQKMIVLNMFKEPHINEEETYFILSDQVYDEYLNTVESFRKRKEEEIKKAKNSNTEKNNENNELYKVMDLGKKYIKELEDANKSINSPDVSSKLFKMQSIVSEIFKNVEKNPAKLSEVKKFINHYLPISIKLVNTYKDLEKQSIEVDNIKKAKGEIEKSLDLINTAFEKLLDDLFESVAMDISSDISVLETLFNQEGLTDDDFLRKK